MSQVFKRAKEDFACEHCGAAVRGNGYTNHCPQCLWSKHVDNFPGDRAATCGGAMKPVRLEQKAGTFILIHTCELCGKTISNKVAPDDNLADFVPV